MRTLTAFLIFLLPSPECWGFSHVPTLCGAGDQIRDFMHAKRALHPQPNKEKKKKRSIYYAPTVCQALGLERKKKYRRVLLSWTPHSSGRRQTSWVWWHMPLIPALEVPGYVERYYLKQKQTRRHAITEGAKWRTVIEAIDVTENTRMAWEWSGWGLRPIEDDISAKVWEV